MIKPQGAKATKNRIDDPVKAQKSPVFVIPTKLVLDSDRGVGIQANQSLLDSRVCGSDGFGDFLRVCQVGIENC